MRNIIYNCNCTTCCNKKINRCGCDEAINKVQYNPRTKGYFYLVGLPHHPKSSKHSYQTPQIFMLFSQDILITPIKLLKFLCFSQIESHDSFTILQFTQVIWWFTRRWIKRNLTWSNRRCINKRDFLNLTGEGEGMM